MTRNVGGAGESHFKLMCNLSGLVANGSLNQDFYGWDFIVEFPANVEAVDALDSQSSPEECKVQVKSSDKNTGYEAVKISVLYRLAVTPVPAFFCFLEFNNDSDPDVYLVHVDKNMIEKILQRVRKLESQKKRDKLYEHTMRIHYKQEHKLDTNIKDALLKHIPYGMNTYIKEKLFSLESLGYEDDSQKMSIVFASNTGNPANEFADMCLGLKKSMEAISVEAKTKRFGIELPNEQLSSRDKGPVRVSFTDHKPRATGYLFFKENEHFESVEFDAALYVVGYPVLEAGKYKWRIVTDYFEITGGSDSKESVFKTTWNPNNELPLEEYRNYAWLFTQIFRGGSLSLGFITEESTVNLGLVGFASEKNNDMEDLLVLSDRCLEICNQFRISTKRVKVFYGVLESNKEKILQLYLCISNIFQELTFELEVGNDCDESPSVVKLALMSYGKLRIGSICIGYSAAFLFNNGGKLSEDKKTRNLHPNQIEMGEFRFGSAKEINLLTHDELVEPLKKKLNSGGYSIQYINEVQD